MYVYSVLRIYKKKTKKQPECYREKPDFLFLDNYTLNVFSIEAFMKLVFHYQIGESGLLIFCFCFSNLTKHNNYYIFDHCTETYLTVKQVIHQN